MVKPLTVGKLIEMLKEYPAKTPIMLSADPEGNNFSPLDEHYSVGGLQWATKDLSELLEPTNPSGTEALVIYPIR